MCTCVPHLTPVQLIKPSRSTTLIIGKKRGKRDENEGVTTYDTYAGKGVDPRQECTVDR